MDRIGRKQTMTLGFFLWGLLGFILGGALGPIQTVFPLFVVLYGIFNALGEMGLGVATFLTASESFPTPLRGLYIGFAAAVDKAGAVIGTQVFTPIQKSLEGDLESEDIKFRRYLEDNGYDTSELDGKSLVEQVKKTAFTLEPKS
ncbi:hypothetical protein OEA41_005772 [Lepraria neglecta]|uniref:Major facilitator superfamily (MFS) profile domain-containing protein n=1 Tax=Lepraria neglecta TaxID=209136 RepID=A0AAE0DKD6_9LECA|nr:hypothetical protein OEA41_005772 [Lepraria neglecta]